jgi:transposase
LTDDNLEVMFYDEAFFKRESTITRGWYLKGIKHSVLCPVTKEKVGVSGAVNWRYGTVFSLIFNGCDSNTFIYYLNSLLENYRGHRKIALILDNASSHKSKAVKSFVESVKERLELTYLPPYSPDLNPVERVWKDLRYKVTHNVYFDSQEELENRVSDYLKNRSFSYDNNGNLYCIT